MTIKILRAAIGIVVAVGSLTTLAHADITEEMRMMNSAENQGAFIEAFANLLHDRKEKDVIAALDPASIQGATEEQVLEALRKDVLPFFAQFQKMSNYENVTKAQAPDGRVGLWHYTYMTDTKGNDRPFQIAIVEARGELKVLGILVGKCVKGRHPPIAPCG